MKWNNFKFYAFPPFSQILKTLDKIKQDKAEGILVVPDWKNQQLYPIFCNLIISKKLYLGPNQDLLLSIYRDTAHPRAEYLRLVSAIVSGKRSPEGK